MSRKIMIIGFIAMLLVGFLAAVIFSKAVIPASVFYGIFALGIVAGGIVLLMKYKPREGDIMKRSTAYAMKYWQDVHKETLTDVNARKMYKEYDGVPHIGFTLRRRDGIRVGQACGMILKKVGNSFSVVKEAELVTDAYELMNPFYYFGGTMEGAPVPYPERHVIMGLSKHGKHGSSAGQNVFVGTKDYEQQQNEHKKK